MNNTEQILKDILEESQSINPKLVSNEVLDWVAENVVYFIDNKSRMFKLDLIIDDSKANEFPETKKLQDLYHKIPDENKTIDVSKVKVGNEDWTQNLTEEENRTLELIGNCRNELDKITAQVHTLMTDDSERRHKIYEKMSYFYEVKGINRGQFLMQELDGAVGIMRFEYESYSVPVKVVKKENVRNQDGSITQRDGEVMTEYVIPEGFSIWVEIAMRPKTVALF